jgi:hypothetical protein
MTHAAQCQGSTFCPIPYILKLLSAGDQYRASSIEHPVSSIEYPVSSIEYPVSSIQYRVSSSQKFYIIKRGSTSIATRIGCRVKTDGFCDKS